MGDSWGKLLDPPGMGRVGWVHGCWESFGFGFGKNCGGNINLSDVSRWDKLHSCPQLVPIALQLISIDLAFLI